MMDNHHTLWGSRTSYILSLWPPDAVLQQELQGMGDSRFASASKGHASNRQRATRGGAVRDEAHSVSRKQEEELDKPLDSVSLSELCSQKDSLGAYYEPRRRVMRCLMW